MEKRAIKRALISVYHKEGIDKIALKLNQLGVEIISTGGTFQHIASLGVPVTSVEEITNQPEILGGRVKTRHPKVFGAILASQESPEHLQDLKENRIEPLDLVIVDLYPFEEEVKSGSSESEIIEKIDIGGISLIRAAAKNYRTTLVIPSRDQYHLIDPILERGGESTLEERATLAAHAFSVTSHYDTQIFNYFNERAVLPHFKESVMEGRTLRYGENPHQKALFYGDASKLPTQLWGKELSYNNLLDLEAAMELIAEFEEPTVTIIKHNNACGCASRPTVLEAWQDALAADPQSAFGGVIAINREVDVESAKEIDKLFFEIIVAPSYSQEALEILKGKSNRIILVDREGVSSTIKYRTLLGGVLLQDRDSKVEDAADLTTVTRQEPTAQQIADLLFANKIVKHTKSNAIVLAKDGMMLASGMGQTSRVDALNHAIAKAKHFGLDLKGAVMASDAFFPFPDCAEIANLHGIEAIIHPGGSIRDQDTTDYCNLHQMTMVTTGFRHFKH